MEETETETEEEWEIYYAPGYDDRDWTHPHPHPRLITRVATESEARDGRRDNRGPGVPSP